MKKVEILESGQVVDVRPFTKGMRDIIYVKPTQSFVITEDIDDAIFVEESGGDLLIYEKKGDSEPVLTLKGYQADSNAFFTTDGYSWRAFSAGTFSPTTESAVHTLAENITSSAADEPAAVSFIKQAAFIVAGIAAIGGFAFAGRKDIKINPEDITLKNNTVKENDAGAVISDIYIDRKPNDIKLNDDRFEIVDNKLKLKDGVSLDFEKEKGVSIKASVIYDNGEVHDKYIYVNVTDVNETPKDNNHNNDDHSNNDNQDNDHNTVPKNELDDTFHVGKGSNTVYGDEVTQDKGGLDTVVYNFIDTVIKKGDLNSGFVKGDFNHSDKTGVNTAIVNIDNTPDSLSDIEQLQFIDAASDEVNLLAGGSGMGKINGLGGNDYLYGAQGDDTFIKSAYGGSDRIHGGAGNDHLIYDFNAKDPQLAIKNFSLAVSGNEDNGTRFVDHLYSVEKITLNNETKSTADWLKAAGYDEQTLLETYQPIFHYDGGDNTQLGVYGEIVTDKDNHKVTGINYELRGNDQQHYFVHVALGEDLLPTYFYTETRGANGEDHSVQIRNAFDTDLSHQGNHVEVWVNLNNNEAYLTKEIPADHTLENYSLLGKTSGNDWDFADIRSGTSDLYESAPTPKLAGLPSGQMEMGFFFQETNLAKLGHFDLIGNPIDNGHIM